HADRVFARGFCVCGGRGLPKPAASNRGGGNYFFFRLKRVAALRSFWAVLLAAMNSASPVARNERENNRPLERYAPHRCLHGVRRLLLSHFAQDGGDLRQPRVPGIFSKDSGGGQTARRAGAAGAGISAPEGMGLRWFHVHVYRRVFLPFRFRSG